MPLGPIGDRIRDLRKERGLTLTEVAQKLQISPSYLSSIERNVKRPTIHILKRVSRVLNVPVNYLIADTQPSSSDLASKLRFFREARCLTLCDMAEISEIPINILEAFEKGESVPSFDQVERVAAALNIPSRYLLDCTTSINELGFKIREIRQKQGLTVSELAEKAGVSPGLISQIENGYTVPLLDTLEKIAQALGVSISYFFVNREEVYELLSSLNQDTLELLSDPQVQAVLRAVRDLTAGELNFILKYIDLFKRHRSQIQV